MKESFNGTVGKYLIGMDIGATNIKHILLDIYGNILQSRDLPTARDSYNSLVEQIENILKNYIESMGGKPAAAGLAFPGFIDFIERKLIESPNMEILNNRSLWDDISGICDSIPFVIENDANAAAYGEYTARRFYDSGLTDLVLLTLGSGVGGGVITGSKLLKGSRGFAGELGHIKIKSGGRICGCGSAGCAEGYISNYGIVDTYLLITGKTRSEKAKISDNLSAAKIAHLALDGEQAAVSTFKATGSRLGILLSILINIFNPQIIALGGGIVASSDLFLPFAIEEAGRRTIKPSFSSVKIEKAVLGSEAGAYGTAILARDYTCMDEKN